MVALVGASGSARAGGFVGLGIGTASQLDDGLVDNGSQQFTSDGRSGRLIAGYSLPLWIGHIAAEGAYTGFGVARLGHHATYDGSTFWLAARYNYPLSAGFEFYGRLGIQHTSVTDNKTNSTYESGNGPVVSLGAEYHPPFPFHLPVDVSVWVDLTYEHMTLTREAGGSKDLTASDHFGLLGVSVGF